jgi:hypothetical protein
LFKAEQPFIRLLEITIFDFFYLAPKYLVLVYMAGSFYYRGRLRIIRPLFEIFIFNLKILAIDNSYLSVHSLFLSALNFVKKLKQDRKKLIFINQAQRYWKPFNTLL